MGTGSSRQGEAASSEPISAVSNALRVCLTSPVGAWCLPRKEEALGLWTGGWMVLSRHSRAQTPGTACLLAVSVQGSSRQL
jgi:hypothetical protein